MKEKLLTLEKFDRAKAWIEAALQDLQRTLSQHDVHVYRELTGTAAVTATPYTHAKWDVVDESVTEYRDGMIVCVKVPVAGHGTYGTGLQINSLGYKPVVYNVNSMVATRYSVGSVVWAVYNATQTASLYVNSASASTITGCWQVMDYDSNTTSIYTLQRYNGTRVVSADLLRYVIAFRKNETTIVPIHSVAGTGTSANTAVTSTNKTMTTESFDPFGEIYQYATNTKIAANESVNLSALRTQCASVDARYIFNCNKTLTAQREIYLVVDLQSDGMVKLATSVNPWSQTLPSTNDGHLYILLGYAYSTYQMEIYYYHPIYYHDGTQLRQYSGDAIGGGSSLPSQTGNSGKILSTDGSDASWGTLNSAIPVLTSPVRVWNLERGIYFIPVSCVFYYKGSSDTSSITLPPSLLVVVDVVASVSKKWDCFPNTFGSGDPIRYRGVTMENSGDVYTEYSSEFSHTGITAVNTSTTTITFDASKRCSQMIGITNDLDITFVVNNSFDNYLWITNAGNSDADITISAVTRDGSSVSSSNIHIPAGGISVPAGGICEIGIIVNANGAFITSRNDLE